MITLRSRAERPDLRHPVRCGSDLKYLPMIEPVARIYIELQNIQPRIWRRVDVPLTSHLLTLHYIIQFGFGWTDSHLFQFTIGNRNYGVPSEEDEFWGLKVYRAAGLRLRTLIERGVERFVYVYDFGDDWRHDIVIERVAEGRVKHGLPSVRRRQAAGAARGRGRYLRVHGVSRSRPRSDARANTAT